MILISNSHNHNATFTHTPYLLKLLLHHFHHVFALRLRHGIEAPLRVESVVRLLGRPNDGVETEDRLGGIELFTYDKVVHRLVILS